VPGQAVEDEVGEHRDILPAIAQRRHPQFDDVQPVVEVVPELARLDAFAEALVRGADDPHVHRLFLRVAHLPDLLLLDGAEQLHLHRQGQVGHLVEEQRAAMGRLEETVAVGVGTGEGALAIAEELALHQVLGDRPAVHRHERLVAAGALLMDEPGGEFLAAAGFAGDVDGGLAPRELLDHVAHVLHDRRAADEPLVGRHLRLGRWQRERRLHERTQLLQRNRLGEIVEGAGLQRRDRILGVPVRGDDGHRQIAHVLRDELDELQPLAIGQAHVGQAEVVLAGLHLLDGLLHPHGALHLEPHAQQREFDQFENVLLVVHDEDRATDDAARVRLPALQGVSPGDDPPGRKRGPDIVLMCASSPR
jgi:hypothetical protein